MRFRHEPRRVSPITERIVHERFAPAIPPLAIPVLERRISPMVVDRRIRNFGHNVSFSRPEIDNYRTFQNDQQTIGTHLNNKENYRTIGTSNKDGGTGTIETIKEE